MNNYKYLVVFLALLLSACGSKDSNSKPIYGKETGLPANCRAYVQVAINEWRNKTYDTETTINAIERNCGESGSLWEYKP